jgi:hypothetical protein
MAVGLGRRGAGGDKRSTRPRGRAHGSAPATGRMKCPACKGSGWLTSEEFKRHEKAQHALELQVGVLENTTSAQRAELQKKQSELTAVKTKLQKADAEQAKSVEKSVKSKVAEFKRAWSKKSEPVILARVAVKTKKLSDELATMKQNEKASVEQGIAKFKTQWMKEKADTVKADVAKQLAEELQRLGITPQDRGRALEANLCELLRQRYPHHRVTPRGKTGDNDLEVLALNGKLLGGINAEIKRQEVITRKEIEQAKDGFRRSKMLDFCVLVTTAKFLSINGKKRPFHAWEYLQGDNVIVVSALVVHTVYDFLIRHIEARVAHTLTPSEASAVGQRLECWLRDAAWKKWLDAGVDRISAKSKRLRLDRTHIETSFEERERHIFEDEFDQHYISAAVAAIYSGVEPQPYARPRPGTGKPNLQAVKAAPARQAAYRSRPRPRA